MFVVCCFMRGTVISQRCSQRGETKVELVCRLKRGHAGNEEPAELPGPGCRPAAVASWVCGEARRLLLTALT